MPDIEFNCPHCKQSLAVEETGAGMAVQCPGCGKEVTVPQLPQPATPSRPTLKQPEPESSVAPQPAIPAFDKIESKVSVGTGKFKIPLVAIVVIGLVAGAFFFGRSRFFGKQQIKGEGKYESCYECIQLEDARFCLSVYAYENGALEFSFFKKVDKTGFVTQNGVTDLTKIDNNAKYTRLPDLPVAKFQEALAAFAKFDEWIKTSKANNLKGEKDFPNPWDKITFSTELSEPVLFFNGDMLRAEDIQAFKTLADRFPSALEKAKQTLAEKKRAGDLLK